MEDVKPIARNITDPTVLAKIGEISMRWSFAESIVEDIIVGFLDTELRYSYVLTTNINISTRLQIVQALGHQRLEPADFEKLDSIVKFGSALAPLRNKVVHGLWSEANDPDVQFVEDYRSRGKLKYHAEWMTPDYLDWLAEQIRLFIAQLLDFGKRFGWFA
jgi:hypothetical protein